MFALFEAGSQVVGACPTPRFGYASRGANRVAPLRGAERYELALVRGAGRGVELLKFAYCHFYPKIFVVLLVCY